MKINIYGEFRGIIIKKVLNNNVITIINENNQEVVVMGRGIAFQKRRGDEVDESQIEKIFVTENKSVNEKLLALVNDIPVKYLEISEEIIKYAEDRLDTKLNENIYLTLTDHISFAINRYENNLEGKYFNTVVKKGDKVNVGDTLVEFDMDAIKKEVYELITPVIITNANNYLEIVPKEIKTVNTGDAILTIL